MTTFIETFYWKVSHNCGALCAAQWDSLILLVALKPASTPLFELRLEITQVLWCQVCREKCRFPRRSPCQSLNCSPPFILSSATPTIPKLSVRGLFQFLSKWNKLAAYLLFCVILHYAKNRAEGCRRTTSSSLIASFFSLVNDRKIFVLKD